MGPSTRHGQASQSARALRSSTALALPHRLTGPFIFTDMGPEDLRAELGARVCGRRSSTVHINYMVVEAGERVDIAAGTATSACSGGDLCNTARGCTARMCEAPDRATGLEPVQIRFRSERSSPLVLTQLQSHAHGSSWASASVEDVTDSGFSSRVIPEPSAHPPREHPTEVSTCSSCIIVTGAVR